MQTAVTLEKPGVDRAEDLKEEIQELALEKDAIILAHNYQVPEVQDIAHLTGDSLQLSRWGRDAKQKRIAFCGVHFMAETASILSPEKQVLLPDLRAGCSLADSMTAEELQAWRDKHPGAIVINYVNTSAAVKALSDYCMTSSNAVAVTRHVIEKYGTERDILVGPDMWLGAFIARELKVSENPELSAKFHVWSGECHVHAGIKPADITKTREENPDAEFLIHPECGCSTQVMEYVASGDIETEGVHMLSTGQMLKHVEENPEGKYVVATETGMLYPLKQAAPKAQFVEANPCAVCPFMKMTNLLKLRDSLRDLKYEVKVPEDIAEKARIPIERMVAIG